MKLQENLRSRSLFDLCQRSLRFQTLILFYSKTIGLFETEYHVKGSENSGKKSLYNCAWSLNQDGRHARIVKTFNKRPMGYNAHESSSYKLPSPAFWTGMMFHAG